MSKDFKNLLNYMNAVEPPADLYQSVFLNIKERQKKGARTRVFFLGLISFFSLASLFPLSSLIFKSFSQSGFFNYLSLAFSGDIIALASFWKEFIFSLAESLPFTVIALLLSAVAVFLWSSNKVVKNIGPAFARA